MRRLEGLTVLVAGGAGSIGTATCLRIAKEGARIGIGDLRHDEAERIAAHIADEGGEAIGLFLDLEDHGSIDAAFTRTEQAFGPVLRLHCNGAAIDLAHSTDLDALDTELDIWERTLRINLTGYLACMKRALPAMIEARDGAIVATSSGAAWVPEHVRVAYGVAKAGVNQLIRHIAHRWGKQGIRANAIAPGVVMAPTTATAERLEGLIARACSPRIGAPADIAAMVAMLMSVDGEWITGQTLAVDGGLTLRQ